MNEKQIANYWYMKGVKDAETTERQDVELSQTLKDFETHFELQYKYQKSAIPLVSDSHFTEFCCFVTGHDESTISQMYQDWKRYR